MSLNEARQIVGPDCELTDAQLLALRDALQPLARLIVEGLRADRQQTELELLESSR